MSDKVSGEMTEATLKALCVQNPLSTPSLHQVVHSRKRETVPETSSTIRNSTPINGSPSYEENDSDKDKPSVKVKFAVGNLKDVKRILRELESRHGWKAYRTANDGSAPLIVVPRGGAIFKRHHAVENLEFFRDPDALMSHFANNTCLVAKWDHLWYHLHDFHDWEEVTLGGGTFFHQPSDKLLNGKSAPGLHVFSSKEQLTTYIQRYPFLLQTDVNLDALLTAHDWKTEPDPLNHNRKVYEWKGDSNSSWLTLKQLRTRLWTYPEMLFSYYPEINLAHVLNFIRGFPTPPTSGRVTPVRPATAPPLVSSDVSSAIARPVPKSTVPSIAQKQPDTIQERKYVPIKVEARTPQEIESHLRRKLPDNAVEDSARTSPLVSSTVVAASSSGVGEGTMSASAAAAAAEAVMANKKQRLSPSTGKVWDKTFLRVAGPSDCQQYLEGVQQQERQSRRKNEGDASATNSTNNERKQKFEKQKVILHATVFPDSKQVKLNWKREHLRVPNMSLFGDHEDIFVCPRHEGQSKFQPSRAYDSHIENLEYFHHWESMATHIEQNPCLLLDWKDLWKKLAACGWKKSEEGVYEFQPAYEALHKLVDGVHRFTSCQGLKCYIDKFPYLLQSDDLLLQTLVNHRWRVVYSSRVKVLWPGLNDEFKTKDAPMTMEQEVPLNYTRKMLWVYPVILYHQYYRNGEVNMEAVLNAIRYKNDSSEIEDSMPTDQSDDELHSESDEDMLNGDKFDRQDGPFTPACTPPAVEMEEDDLVSLENGMPAIVSTNKTCVASLAETVLSDSASCQSRMNKGNTEDRLSMLRKCVGGLMTNLESAGLLVNADKSSILESVVELLETKLFTAEQKGVVQDPILLELQQIQKSDNSLPRWAQLMIEHMTRPVTNH